MPSKSLKPRGRLARITAREIKAQMSREDITGVQLAERIDRSQNYVAKRLRGELPFTVEDLEMVAPVLHLTPEELVGIILAAHGQDTARTEKVQHGTAT